MSRPMVIWGNAVNLSGLYSRHAKRCRFDPDVKAWYDGIGDLEVKRLGEVRRPGIIIFGSEDKAEVQRWTDGVAAAMDMLYLWTGR